MLNINRFKYCYIFGAGEYYAFKGTIPEDAFVIAADGGYDVLLQKGVTPNLFIGDGDSVAKRPTCERIELPEEKDDTDMLAAIRVGLELGYKEFHIYGGTGGRIDHTIANIQSLMFIKNRGGNGYLYDDKKVLSILQNETIWYNHSETGMISIFAMGDRALKVTETGLKYALNEAMVTKEFPIGISNEFIGTKSSITVENGTLLIIKDLQR